MEKTLFEKLQTILRGGIVATPDLREVVKLERILYRVTGKEIVVRSDFEDLDWKDWNPGMGQYYVHLPNFNK